LVKVSAVAAVLPAASVPVTVSPGELVVSADHEKALETYGPPAGVLTTEGLCAHPVKVPDRAAVALESGPEPASLTALVSVNEPTAEPR
jgi:hypothetical protein